VPVFDNKKMESKSKEEREREKKESKEAEKARKAAEKEKAKADEKRRKELESTRKEYQKTQAEDVKKALTLSKLSAAEDEERRKREVGIAGKENGTSDKGAFGLGSLSRSHKGSKSMSRKSFAFLGGRPGQGESSDSHAVVEGEAGPQMPEKHEKLKDRFSFSGLGRKKSNLMNS
jgi:ubiquitin carboxyl-terminal hydrolase 9/13